MTKETQVLLDLTSQIAKMTDAEKRAHMDEHGEIIYEEHIGKTVIQLIIFDQAENGYEGFSYTRYGYPDGLDEDWSYDYNESWDDLSQAIADTKKVIDKLKKKLKISTADAFDTDEYKKEVSKKAQETQNLIVNTMIGKTSTEEFYNQVVELKKWIGQQKEKIELVEKSNQHLKLIVHEEDFVMLFDECDPVTNMGELVATIAVTRPPIEGRVYHVYLCTNDFEVMLTK